MPRETVSEETRSAETRSEDTRSGEAGSEEPRATAATVVRATRIRTRTTIFSLPPEIRQQILELSYGDMPSTPEHTACPAFISNCPRSILYFDHQRWINKWTILLLMVDPDLRDDVTYVEDLYARRFVRHHQPMRKRCTQKRGTCGEFRDGYKRPDGGKHPGQWWGAGANAKIGDW
ncbi:hypothetical protein FKW77_003761 [Venturia effusa]|uniref:Uncharacterized protein n=1 Tax=Venturia effusa TaxID=50376 RepID=A0A517LIG3_9PEZI|nr:hypothetical protein FKW77_003761 [Venturia effusa]